jgi:hypothetical protein
MNTQTLRESVTDAIHYWEPRRLGYNFVLATVVLACFWIADPASKSILSVDLALVVFLMAVLANVAYCAVYVVDVFTQASGYRDLWRRYRWTLFAIGTAFAGVLTRFFALGMFSPSAN